MRNYPIPFNEEARLRSLFSLPDLASENDGLFESLCEATRKLLNVPVAHISVVEKDMQWYKAVVGMELERMPRSNSFCTHTIMSNEPLVVCDLSKDPRFKQHPMVVKGSPEARYYAGVPLVLSSGHRLGSLCGLDLVPHDPPSQQQMAILADLGRAVVAALEGCAPSPLEQVEDHTAKSTFITLIGHELRTPLTILRGSLQLMEAKSGGDARLLGAAQKSVQHLIKLVETVIAFSDVSTGELRLNEQNCELKDLFAEIADLQLPDRDGIIKSIQVEEKKSLTQQVYVDAEQIKIALNALVLNAIFHGGQNIRVGGDTDAEGDIVLWVSDSGKFGDHVEMEKLYEPFVVGGDRDYRDTRGGLGLGLPLTRKLVELHGGEFEVLPDPKGTTALIRLPAWRTEMS